MPSPGGMPGPSGPDQGSTGDDGRSGSTSGEDSSYEPLPGGGTPPPGMPGGDGGTEDTAGGTGAEGDDTWDAGIPSDDGWVTSNETPDEKTPSASQDGTAMGLPTPGSASDEELDAALGDFDGEIMSERDIIQKRSNETANGAIAALPPSTSDPSASAPGDGPQPASTTFIPRNRSAPPAPGPAGNNVPDDIPDAKDDDIIARQLREAAMKETDPELKEKLWEEYRRYKNS